ncbi:heme-dependent oxidative N-demethylase family protein [Marivita sp.]|uniref:heme-dependent oxidative N-demethylase family protein n=1 Tax=Marivita sp. TaxID=2003365 RepID=UPI003F6B16F1
MILQTSLPYDVLTPRPLPGVAPLGNDPWFLVDEAYTAQMAERLRLMSEQRPDVIATDAPSHEALNKMMDAVLGQLPPEFEVSGDTVRCPDGRRVTIDRDDPFGTLGQIVQDDICLLEKRGEEHVLTGAALCFPASWRLREKIGHPLTHIHVPVQTYTDDIARRVQRLFDGVRPGLPIWRFNALWYEDPSLYQPRSETEPRQMTEAGKTPYLRSERQVLWRLPDSDAVLFTIHTFMLARNDVPGAEDGG